MRSLVTIGSDGPTDWVRTPDGQRFNLGQVSVLSFITKLTLGGSREARAALDKFLQGDEVMLRVDDDMMWDMLAPRRTRWAADSFIPPDHRKRGNGLMTIDADLHILDQHIQMLQKAAKTNVPAEKMAEGVSILVRLARKIGVDQSDNAGYYGLDANVQEATPGSSEVVTVEDVEAVKLGGTPKLAYDVYKANSDVATRILDQMEATDVRINELVTAGKKFNVVKAKADIHAVTSKVAGIVSDTDLTTPWVAEDIGKLAKRAEHLYGLFFPKE